MEFDEVKRLVDETPDDRVAFVENGEVAFVAHKPQAKSRRQMTSKGTSYTIFPNVHLGKNVTIEDYCVIGAPPRGSGPGDLATVIGDNAVIRSHTVIYAGNKIGDDFQTGHHVLIREQNIIGNSVHIGSYSNIEHHVRIADNVNIHSKVFIPEYSELQDRAWIGPGTVMTNTPFPRSSRVKDLLEGPLIESDAKVGAATVLLPGVVIGQGALVGAGSVVTHNVPAHSVVAGSPARVTKDVSELRYKDTGDPAYPGSAIPPSVSFEKFRSEATPSKNFSIEINPTKTIPLVDLNAQYQTIKPEIDEAIARVIASSAFIQGEEVKKFEEAFAEYCGAKHCIGVSNGTTAIELVLRGLGIGPGDEVITTPMTFIATTEPIITVGAKPVFVDVDEQTGTLDPRKLFAAITPKTRVIMPVHLYGRPADMLPILEIARAHKLIIIEDCAQAHGATYSGRMVPLSIGTFSFYPGKNLGAYGDAGAIVLNEDTLAETVRHMRDHGRSTKYEHQINGMNGRMDGIQGAVLRAKLAHLPDWILRRREIAKRYKSLLAGLPIVLPFEDIRSYDVYHLFVIRTPQRDRLAEYLHGKGISTGIHYPIVLHLQPVYRHMSLPRGSFPVAEQMADQVLSLPIYSELTDSQIDQIGEHIRSFFRNTEMK